MATLFIFSSWKVHAYRPTSNLSDHKLFLFYTFIIHYTSKHVSLLSWACYCVPVIPALERVNQDYHCEFKDSLNGRVKICLKKDKTVYLPMYLSISIYLLIYLFISFLGWGVVCFILIHHSMLYSEIFDRSLVIYAITILQRTFRNRLQQVGDICFNKIYTDLIDNS